MARVIKLRESDITNIVRRILNEEKSKKGEGPSKKEIGRPDDKKWRDLGKIFLKDVKTVKQLKSKLTKFYNQSPDWVKDSVGMTPAEAFRKFDEEGGGGDDGPEMLVWWWIAMKVIFYVAVAWQLCCMTYCTC